MSKESTSKPTDAVVAMFKRSVAQALAPKSGMTVGMPKVSIEASQAARICKLLDLAAQREAELVANVEILQHTRDLLMAEVERLRGLAVTAYRAGAGAAHDATVEGCYNNAHADDSDEAAEWLEDHLEALRGEVEG